MAKTVFANGSVILPAWINSIFGNNGAAGHVHDGVNDDGHVQKIHPYDHVDLSINSLTMTITTSYFTTQQTGTLTWARVGRLVYLHMEQILAVSNSATLRAAISGSPALPTPYPANQYLPCMLEDGNDLVFGEVKITPSQFDFCCFPAAAAGVKLKFGDNFETSNLKGFLDQTLCYICT